MSVSKFSSIDEHEFEKVCLVFVSLGYAPPVADPPKAYIMDIAEQSEPVFSMSEILRIVDFAKSHTLEQIRFDKDRGWIDRQAVFGESR